MPRNSKGSKQSVKTNSWQRPDRLENGKFGPSSILGEILNCVIDEVNDICKEFQQWHVIECEIEEQNKHANEEGSMGEERFIEIEDDNEEINHE